MALLDDLRVDLGDDDGLVPSGQAPPNVVPVIFTESLLGDLRVDLGDDDGIIPSGTFVGNIQVHDLLGPVHGDTTPAAPNAGDLIVGGGTWSALPQGSEGQVLSILGGQVVWAVDTAGASGLAAHAADPDAHHTRYTDAEASGVASGLIAIHTADSGAHHDRYTDAEAAAVAAQVLATGVLDVAIIQESGVELTVDATTTSVLPVLSTLLSVPIGLVKPSGNLRILATASVNANGPVPVVFHIYIDGVFHRGTTVNVTGAIDNAAIVIPRVSVTGSNPHTVDLRWAKFASPFVTVNCLPASLPDFYHASLSVQEIL